MSTAPQEEHKPRIRDRLGHAFASLGQLPEASKIMLGVVAGLAVVAGPIVVYLYHGAIWRAVVTACAVSVILAGLACVLYLAALAHRWNQRRTDVVSQAAYAASATSEAERVAYLRAISEGRVQPLTNAGDLLVRQSEVVWWRCRAVTNDRRGDSHAATLHVTSLRVVFDSASCPAEIPLGHINSVRSDDETLEIAAKTASMSQQFRVPDGEVVAAFVRRAVQVYHRQVDVGFESDASRHIPQDVKAAVWQRDGGRCVECGADDYLEFDHIIPFARGGSSTTENVQLLCRRCNLRKGNRI